LQSHIYLFCNHTAIKSQSRTCLFMQLGFFCNRSTSAVCNHTVKDVCNHLYFHQVATTSSKDQSSRNLIVSWHWAFFELVYCNRTFFTCFLQSQSHCYKGAITLRQDLQSTTFCFATVFFCNRSTSVVANTMQSILQSPVFWSGCSHIKQRPP
jgi:hypothetical protein